MPASVQIFFRPLISHIQSSRSFGIILGYIALTRPSRATSVHGPKIMILSVVALVSVLLLGPLVHFGGGGSGDVTTYTVTTP